MTGVYFLFYKRKVVYIGATECWPVRVGVHKGIKFDSAKLFECDSSKIFEYERRLISIFNPRQNVMHTSKQKGRKMNTDWVKKNINIIAPFMDNLNDAKSIKKSRDAAMPLLERMKAELKYSPRTNPADLFFSLKRRYEKLKDFTN